MLAAYKSSFTMAKIPATDRAALKAHPQLRPTTTSLIPNKLALRCPASIRKLLTTSPPIVLMTHTATHTPCGKSKAAQLGAKCQKTIGKRYATIWNLQQNR